MAALQIDPATLELINALLRANVLQLIVLAPVLVMLLQIVHTFMNARRMNQQSSNDDKVINRMIDIADKANENTAALKLAIDNLADASRDKERERVALEQERIDIHRANRESILAQQESITVMATHVQRLGETILPWTKMVDENTHDIRVELERLASEVKNLRDEAGKRDRSQQIDALVQAVTGDVLTKLEVIISRLPPPTEPAAAPKAPLQMPVDADAGTHEAVTLPERKEGAA